MISIGILDTFERGEPKLHVIQPVRIPSELHFWIVETTYGVVPDAAIPITESLLVILYFFKSCHPWDKLSSANSCDFLMALSPPAIKPITKSSETPKVGGHSEASKIPYLPLVPAPI